MKNMALFQKLSGYIYFLFIFYYQPAKFRKNRREKNFRAQRPPLQKLRPKNLLPVFYSPLKGISYFLYLMLNKQKKPGHGFVYHKPIDLFMTYALTVCLTGPDFMDL